MIMMNVTITIIKANIFDSDSNRSRKSLINGASVSVAGSGGRVQRHSLSTIILGVCMRLMFYIVWWFPVLCFMSAHVLCTICLFPGHKLLFNHVPDTRRLSSASTRTETVLHMRIVRFGRLHVSKLAWHDDVEACSFFFFV